MLRYLCCLAGLAGIFLASVLPIGAQPTFDEVIGALRTAERSVTSAVGTTVVNVAYAGRAEKALPGVEMRDYQTTCEWVFQVPNWRQEESYVPKNGRGILMISGCLDDKWTMFYPENAIMQIDGPDYRDGSAAHPTFSHHIGVAPALRDDPWLSDQIVAAKAVVTGTEKVDGIETVVLTAQAEGSTKKWCLAPSFGYKPVRYEQRRPIKTPGGKESIVVEKYSDYSQVASGVWLPRKMSSTKTLLLKNDISTPVQKITASSSFTSANQPVEQEDLVIAAPTGTRIQTNGRILEPAAK